MTATRAPASTTYSVICDPAATPTPLRMVPGEGVPALTAPKEPPMPRPRKLKGTPPGPQRGPAPRAEAVDVVLTPAPGLDDTDTHPREGMQA